MVRKIADLVACDDIVLTHIANAILNQMLDKRAVLNTYCCFFSQIATIGTIC